MSTLQVHKWPRFSDYTKPLPLIDFDQILKKASQIFAERFEWMDHYHQGRHHLDRPMVAKSDGLIVLSRIRQDHSQQGLKDELTIMQFLREQTSLYIPKTYASSHDPKTGVSFMLMEYIDAAILPEAAQSNLDALLKMPQKNQIWKQLAETHLKLASIRSPVVGSLTREDDGELVMSALKDGSGPFMTTIEYWENLVKLPSFEFQRSEAEILELSGEHGPEILQAIINFPPRFIAYCRKRFGDAKSPDRTLQCLAQLDFGLHNILFDDKHTIRGVIDCFGSEFLPCIWMRYPSPLCDLLPRELDFPSGWNENGPGSARTRQILEERKIYLEYVRKAEEIDMSNFSKRELLSKVLEDPYAELFSNMLRCWLDGTPCFFNRALDVLEKQLSK